MADDFRQAGEGAYVGGETDVDFLDAEDDVGGADADVCACADVDRDAV